jgi:hypothetical protein
MATQQGNTMHQTATQIQAHQLAGLTRLTAVTLRVRNTLHTAFVMLRHDAAGRPDLPLSVESKLLPKEIQRGETISFG